jgi:DNA modification methylase
MSTAKKPAAKPRAPKTTAEVPIAEAILTADFRPIDALIPYHRNARTHSDEQIAQLAGAIEEFGWTNPVLADAAGIVAGHGRVMAARKLYDAGQTITLPNGLQIPPGTVPVLDCTGWSVAKRRAYILADNQLALNAGWDEALLAVEIADLQGMDFDMGLIGFDVDYITELLGKNVKFGDGDPDEEIEPPANPVTRAGDVWLLGHHRIICGDSTNAETVQRVLNGAKPHLMVTDPPYGVEYDANWRNEASRKSDGMGNRAIGAGAVGKVLNDNVADWREVWAHFPGEVAYVWCASLHAHEVVASLHAHDFVLRSQIIWDKTRLIIGRSDYHWQHEPCYYAVRKGGKGHWNGDRKQTTVWQIPHQKSETGHSTQKPVECMKRPIENNSKAGDAIYEPFSGSGTTLIAAHMTGRVCYAVELHPAYVDVAVTRWERFSEQAATLEGDGRTFAEVMAERLPPGAVTATVQEKPKRKKAAA